MVVSALADSPRIVIERGNVVSRIANQLPPKISDAVSEECSFWLKDAFARGGPAQRGFLGKKRGKMSHFDGRLRLYHKGTRKFRTGLLGRVFFTLRNNGCEVEIREKAVEDEASYRTPKMHIDESFQIRDYQQDCVDTIMAASTCGISVPTGGGKTIIAAKIIVEDRMKTVIIVHTRDLLIQNKQKMEQYLRYHTGEPIKVGMIGGGIVDIQDITVATMQTLCKALGIKFDKESSDSDRDYTKYQFTATQAIKDFVNQVNLSIWDECHRIPSRTAYAIAERLVNVKHSFGMSATPYRLDGKDLMIEAVVGEIAHKITASDLIKAGFLTRPIIQIERLEDELDSGGFLKTGRGTKMTYQKVYKIYIVEHEERNRRIAEHAKRFIGQGKSVIVFVNHVRHANILGGMIGCKVVHASGGMVGGSSKMPFSDHTHHVTSGMDMMERKAVFDQLGNKEILCIVSTLGKEGIDIPSLDACIFAGGGRDTTQQLGRVMRKHPGKQVAFVVDFYDGGQQWIAKHSRERLRRYKAEPEFMILGAKK